MESHNIVFIISMAVQHHSSHFSLDTKCQDI